MKILKYFIIFFIISIITYSVLWFKVLLDISTDLNNKYANTNISSRIISGAEKNFIKFSKVRPTGFPFKFALKITGFVEDNDFSILECTSPVIIGYDLIKQSLFITYTGEAKGLYKPLQSGFGSKIISDEQSIFVKLPLTVKLFKLIKGNHDLFEIVNFIKNVQLQSKKVTARDLIDNTVLYDRDFESMKLSFSKRKYYTDFNDFLHNIPNRLDVYYATKINKASFDRRSAPPSMLFGIFLPFAFSSDINFYIKTDHLDFDDLSKDLEIGVVNSQFSNDVNHLTANILYKDEIINQLRSLSINTDSVLELKEGFVEKCFNGIQYLLNYLPNNPLALGFKNEIENLISLKDRLLSLKELEKHKYNINLDLVAKGKKGDFYVAMKNFSVASGNTGIFLKNDSSFTSYIKWTSTGDILLKNYTKLVDLVGSSVYNTSKYSSYSDDIKKLYIETNKYFLKGISDHPNSLSNDVSFEYKIDSAKITDSKIGRTEINKIPMLYDLYLYKNAAAKLQSGEYTIEKIKELIPNFGEHSEILKQFIK